jgi:D-serine deaminase-like pyridoxal phosphate-dependent protein
MSRSGQQASKLEGNPLPTLSQLPTPLMIIDVDVMDRNIQALADFAEEIDRDVRPHIKTHKSLALARRQLDAGAVGLTVATAWEAEVFSGLCDDLFIARSMADPVALDRLAALAASGVRIIVGVDGEVPVAALGRAAATHSAQIEVRIEIDSGQHRCGVEPAQAAALARRVAGTDALALEGIFTHEGHVYSVSGPGGVDSVAKRVAGAMSQAAEAIRSDGHALPTVSVGSTPARFATPRYEGITEMRPGTYVFNDATAMLLGAAEEAECAAAVLATVISVPGGRQVVVDAGRKAMASDGVPRESVGHVIGCPGARFHKASEEHGIIEWPEDQALPREGERLRIIPFHICPAINLHDELVLVQGHEIVQIVPIDARGYGRASEVLGRSQ